MPTPQLTTPLERFGRGFSWRKQKNAVLHGVPERQQHRAGQQILARHGYRHFS
jgi:hypothetical protein